MLQVVDGGKTCSLDGRFGGYGAVVAAEGCASLAFARSEEAN